MSRRTPGWGEAARRLPGLLIPIGREVGITRLRTRLPALTYVRAVFLSFLILPYVFGLFLVLLGLPFGEGPVEGMEVLVVLGSGATSAMVLWPRSKEVRAEDPSRAADSYVTQFFMAAALASSAALFGFVGAFITDELWVYLPGLAGSTIGLLAVAPTSRDLERRQRQITAGGSSASLLEGLLEPLPPRTVP